LEWGDAHVHDGAVQTRFDEGGFAALPEITKDNWPGR
jgi:hypothetical protein